MKTKIFWFNIFLVVTTVALVAIRLRADDVYNFYFQKAPGPSTVIQGGGPAQAQAPVTTTPASTVSQPVVSNQPQTGLPPNALTEVNQSAIKVEGKSSEPERNFSRWEISLEKVTFTGTAPELGGSSGSQATLYAPGEWSLGVQYNIWSALGLEARAMLGVGQPVNSNTVDYSGGVIITPFRLRAFGIHFIDLAILGGYTSYPVAYSYSGGYYDELEGHPSTYYVGGKASINLGENLAVIGTAELLPDINTTRYTFGVAIKL